jgi:hypothetical protein
LDGPEELFAIFLRVNGARDSLIAESAPLCDPDIGTLLLILECLLVETDPALCLLLQIIDDPAGDQQG